MAIRLLFMQLCKFAIKNHCCTYCIWLIHSQKLCFIDSNYFATKMILPWSPCKIHTYFCCYLDSTKETKETKN